MTSEERAARSAAVHEDDAGDVRGSTVGADWSRPPTDENLP
jgi:hypothetical protein